MNSSKHIDNKTGFIVNNTYYLTKIIGSGASGTVYHSYSLYTGEQYAFKFVHKRNNSSSNISYIPGNFKYIYGHRIDVENYNSYDSYTDSVTFKEFIIQSMVHDHKNVISVFEVLDFPDYVEVVMEYCKMGDLYTALSEQKWYVGDESKVKSAFDQLLEVGEYCHMRSVYHCDLKPENILIGAHGTSLKLADFGLASMSPVSRKFGRGSMFYMAPENIVENERYLKLPVRANVLGQESLKKTRNLITGIRTKPLCGNHLKDKGATEKGCEEHTNKYQEKNEAPQSNGYPKAAGNVWALGVILLNMLFGRSPWKRASIKDPIYCSYMRNFRTLQDLLPVTDDFCMLMARIFHPDPHHRITIQQLRKSLINCKPLIDYTHQFSWFDVTEPANFSTKNFIPTQRGISQLLSNISNPNMDSFDSSLENSSPCLLDKKYSVDSPVTDVSLRSPLSSNSSLASSLSYTSNVDDKYISGIQDLSDPPSVIYSCTKVFFQPYYEATHLN